MALKNASIKNDISICKQFSFNPKSCYPCQFDYPLYTLCKTHLYIYILICIVWHNTGYICIPLLALRSSFGYALYKWLYHFVIKQIKSNASPNLRFP